MVKLIVWHSFLIWIFILAMLIEYYNTEENIWMKLIPIITLIFIPSINFFYSTFLSELLDGCSYKNIIYHILLGIVSSLGLISYVIIPVGIFCNNCLNLSSCFIYGSNLYIVYYTNLIIFFLFIIVSPCKEQLFEFYNYTVIT